MRALPRLPPFVVVAAALAIVSAFVVMTISVSPRVGLTYDELGHITSGYGYWRHQDYRVNAENGVLATRASAAPLLTMELKFAGPASPHWQPINARALGYEFFFEAGNDFAALLRRARLGTLLFGIGLLALIWRWATGLFGATGGLVALGVAAFSPTLLAHAGLATSDIVLACCLLAALGAWWQLWHRVTWPRIVFAGLAAGLACTAKMSGLILLPMLAVLFVVRAVGSVPLIVKSGANVRRIGGSARVIATLAVASSLAAVIAVLVIWGAYGFRYRAQPPTASPLEFAESWDAVLGAASTPANSGTSPHVNTFHPRIAATALSWARDHRVLPEAFLWGLAYTYKSSRARESFLLGRISPHGFRHFFPMAFLLKTTPVELCLLLIGVTGMVANQRRPRSWMRIGYRAAPLLVLFVVYGLAALTTPLNIGHRHLLPLYPVIFIFIGGVARWRFLRRGFGLGVLGTLLAGQAIDSLAARPFYLSYFTPIVGGTKHGWHYLVDSSFDWGQGLPDLAAWLKRKEQRGDRAPVFLTYFGSDSPRARGLPVVRFADARDDHGPRPFPALSGGWYAISATYFQGVYLDLAGGWGPKLEAEYAAHGQALRIDAEQARRLSPEQRAQLKSIALRYEVLQFGRLAYFLRNRPPDEIVGASLLLFRVSDADLAFALDAPFDRLTGARP